MQPQVSHPSNSNVKFVAKPTDQPSPARGSHTLVALQPAVGREATGGEEEGTTQGGEGTTQKGEGTTQPGGKVKPREMRPYDQGAEG